MKKILLLLFVIIFTLSSLTSCMALDIIFSIVEKEVGGEIEELFPDGINLYNDFTPSEKALFKEYFGEVVPFLPSNEYYVEEYDLDHGDTLEIGINYYVYGKTKAQFESYKQLFDKYEYDGTNVDDYGYTWYLYYSDAGFYIDLSYYPDDGEYVVDVFVYYYDDSTGGSSGTEDDVINNNGTGLPQDTSGVYRIDFTKASKVKNVTDLGDFIGGCPTTGKVPVLVIPIEFSDSLASSKGYTIDNIVRVFSGDDTDYYSVEEYYYISSYGQLDLDFTVVDKWFKPKYSSTYYENLTSDDNYSDGEIIGDQVILDEALAYLSKTMDISKFDSDNNGIIDAVVMINTLTVNNQSELGWAYRYWNYYTDDYGSYYEYDGVSANDFLWASYGFIHEKYDESYDEYTYTDTSVMNPFTYIHEFAHVLGADDYYDTEYISEEGPLAYCDIMDNMIGDHNPFTKFNLGWVTTSKLITTNSSVTINLESFSESGDSVIIANNWDEKLGVYQEYYIVVYYTMTGLNGGEYGYFARDGIIVYHVNASLYSQNYNGETYYYIYNNNTTYTDKNGYGTEDNLIEFVKSAEGNFTYTEGERLSLQTDDNGKNLGYTFTVDSVTDSTATLTFTKR